MSGPGPDWTEEQSRAWWRAKGPDEDRSWCKKHKCDKHLEGGPGAYWLCPKCYREEVKRHDEDPEGMTLKQWVHEQGVRDRMKREGLTYQQYLGAVLRERLEAAIWAP